jgi:hypothetical protein
VSTLIKLAKALDVEVRDFFVFPETNERNQAIELLRTASPARLSRVLQELTEK